MPKKMGRPRAEVGLTDSERTELIRLTKRARVNRGVAFRARIVLACATASDTAVARRLRTTKTTVAKWRGQFVERRLDGLYDEPRVGAPRTINDEAIEAVIIKTLETTPPGETHWSTRSMAKAAGLSHSTIGRIWRTFRLQPHRTESFYSCNVICCAGSANDASANHRRYASVHSARPAYRRRPAAAGRPSGDTSPGWRRRPHLRGRARDRASPRPSHPGVNGAQFAGPMEPRQGRTVAAVRLDPIAAALGHRRRTDDT